MQDATGRRISCILKLFRMMASSAIIFLIVLQIAASPKVDDYSRKHHWHIETNHQFCKIYNNNSSFRKTKKLNRLKVVLVEKRRTNKWLTRQLDKDPATIFKWCTNTAQLSLETLSDIAMSLEVDVKDLLQSSIKNQDY